MKEQSLTLYTKRTTLARLHLTNQYCQYRIETGKHKVSETPDRLRCPVGVEKLDSFSWKCLPFEKKTHKYWLCIKCSFVEIAEQCIRVLAYALGLTLKTNHGSYQKTSDLWKKRIIPTAADFYRLLPNTI